MSIYPVRLWHFVNGSEDAATHKSTIRFFAKQATCTVCGKKGLAPTKCYKEGLKG